MKVPLLDLKAQLETIREEVVGPLLDVVESQRFILGQPVQDLERAVAEFVDTDHAIGCASGTDALLLPLMALSCEPGDEIITTPFTFFATAGAIHNAGAKPVFVDIDPRTFNLDIAQVEASINSHTRALLPVHLFGQMAPMQQLVELADKHQIPIIEDAAQAIGARQEMNGNWISPGVVGKCAAFSFFPSKNLGGWGDGGMIVTTDGELADRLRRLRAHGGAKQYHHDEVGTNSRLDTLQAAILKAKLPFLNGWNEARRAHADIYNNAFEKIEGIVTPETESNNEHVYNQYTIRVRDRDELKAFLTDKGIGSAVYYPKPLHLQPCFEHLGYKEGQFPKAELACSEVISLPVFPELTEEQQMTVVGAVTEFFE